MPPKQDGVSHQFCVYSRTTGAVSVRNKRARVAGLDFERRTKHGVL